MRVIGGVLAMGVVERRFEGCNGAFEKGVVVTRGAGGRADDDDGLEADFQGERGGRGVHYGPVICLLAAHAEVDDSV